MMLAFLIIYDKLIFTTLAFICVALGVLYSDQLISYFHSYFIVYVGDFRIYLFDGKVNRLTEDQTLVAREVKMGILSKEDAQRDGRQNVILNMLNC